MAGRHLEFAGGVQRAIGRAVQHQIAFAARQGLAILRDVIFLAIDG
jgi:hypothetical protein